MMVVEDGGRPAFYSMGGQYLGPGPVSQGGGGWADPFSVIVMNGSQPTGSGIVGGPCAVNCTSDNEMFSFHPGGCNVLMGDGAVHFLNQQVPLNMAAAFISANGGELLNWTYMQ
jgi:prepilin-type processing-associated H-X9-DG protein